MKALLNRWFPVLALCLAPLAQAQSLLGNALAFNGLDQNISVANFGNIIPTNEITVEFWADTSKFAGQSAFMLNPDTNTNRFNVHLDYGSSYADALTYWDFGNINNAGVGRLSAPCPPNSINNWVHYAFVASQSGNYMSIYTNGVLQITKSGMTPFVRGSYSLQIGGPGYIYTGSLDEFRVWSVARTQAQIQSDRYAPLSGNEANLVLYLKLDSASGSVATNSATATGAAYNGTVANNLGWVASTIPVPTTVVTNPADSGSGTLRQAVAATVSGGIVIFTNTLSGQTILLTNGEMVLSNSIVIDATSLGGGLTLSGDNASRIFYVNSNQTVSLRGLTLTGGNGVGFTLYGSGGAVENLGALSLTQCTVLNNQASGGSAASLQGSGRGGGICNDSSAASLTLVNCTFTRNQAGTYGGAIENRGSLVAEYCTIYGNGSGSGGGGIDNFGNDYDQGGNYTAYYTLADCIVAGTILTQDIRSEATTATRQGANIVPFTFEYFSFSGSGPGYLTAAPQLAPLGHFGGSTQTMPPLPGSPAIDAASLIPGIPADQRGSARDVGAAPDIGAVESGGLWVQNNTDNSANSLRAVLASAAGVASPKIILFNTNLSGQTITLASQLLVTDPYGVTVDASALSGGVQISGNAATRVFWVTNGAFATLNSLTLLYGLAPPGSFGLNGGGGGIFCGGHVALLNCSLLYNLVVAPGSTPGFAGGIACYNGDVRLTNCTVAFNQAFGPNGEGGAFYNYGGTLMFDHCTVADNLAGLDNGGVAQNGSTLLHATVLANGNVDFRNASGGASLGNNFIADGSSSGLMNGVNGDQIGAGGTAADAALAPLGSYGGLTQTMPPLPGSPLIDAGGVTALATDQRGFPRSAGLAPDIGSVEGVHLVSNAGKLSSAMRLGDGSIQIAFTNFTDANLQVLAATTVIQPVSDWTPIGFATETPPGSGRYQFTDPQAAVNYPQRFYRLESQ
jgi:hypothetical protein